MGALIICGTFMLLCMTIAAIVEYNQR